MAEVLHELLVELQAKYNASASEQDLGILYLALVEEARRQIVALCRKRRMPRLDVEHKAADVAAHMTLRIRSGFRMRAPCKSVAFAVGNRMFGYPERRHRALDAATISLEEANGL